MLKKVVKIIVVVWFLLLLQDVSFCSNPVLSELFEYRLKAIGLEDQDIKSKSEIKQIFLVRLQILKIGCSDEELEKVLDGVLDAYRLIHGDALGSRIFYLFASHACASLEQGLENNFFQDVKDIVFSIKNDKNVTLKPILQSQCFELFLNFIKRDDFKKIDSTELKKLDDLLQKVQRGIVRFSNEQKVTFNKQLFVYVFQQFRNAHKDNLQRFDSKFLAEVEHKERLRNAIEKKDMAFVKKMEKEYLLKGGNRTDSDQIKSQKIFPLITFLGNLYEKYFIMYNSCVESKRLTNFDDFILFLNFRDKFGLSGLVDLISNIHNCQEQIHQIFPLNADVLIAQAKHDRVAFQAELIEEQKRKELEAIEQRKKSLELDQKRCRQKIIAQKLETESNKVLVNSLFTLWKNSAEHTLQEKRSVLAHYFFQFVRAIEHKIVLRTEKFQQDVCVPNALHIKRINDARQARMLLPEVQDFKSILAVQNDDIVDELDVTTNIKKEETRLARIARRKKVQAVKEELKNKHLRYDCFFMPSILNNHLQDILGKQTDIQMAMLESKDSVVANDFKNRKDMKSILYIWRQKFIQLQKNQNQTKQADEHYQKSKLKKSFASLHQNMIFEKIDRLIKHEDSMRHNIEDEKDLDLCIYRRDPYSLTTVIKRLL